uniref:F-actin-capping protein subunit beta n=1 Tax=Paramoeba aestuarina TaxID=180227 RepID=A0A6U3B7L6_9EUKA|mmetsp:Transcript_31327/g.48897  ORF Transcript_31327/g.48897 Transcript_31327/m.48897 type:complete len:271 (+) Transcript_31327:71-883(+)|eukprot:CAMPEP_0201506772 /NCGR_PEP_ID=MMETSP0161_2-20130828/623_1 /ASSEMBLY_ACC=CAM_ASM_000251 /TAXON_ID=180227 /ORGANISM="Neoparamoeba aestuarina, Strain SoJaBio B1-5/56/2" /LENGTH=270 /DNA_ID=CAMNT_0047900957 /DNA_START=78 /DNA_END=890 /DNA_ORIENTATION=-
MADQLDCALDLMRRMPPTDIEDNLANLIDLVPDLCEHLLSAVDQPLKIATDKAAHRDYLLCDYNRDGDSYRSPWSNKYDPPLGDGAVPSDGLRKFEIQANEVFDIYRDLYYEGGVSSVYAWDLDDGFAAVILIKKTQDSTKKGQPMKGTWDSIHVVEVVDQGNSAQYKLTSTVMLGIETETDQSGRVNLGGSMTRQTEQTQQVNDMNPHVSNIGRMVEDMEMKLRTSLETIYFGKTKDIVNELRQASGASAMMARQAFAADISASLGSRG